MVERVKGTTCNGRRGTIVHTTSENFSAPGRGVTQEEWERVFGTREHRSGYRCATRFVGRMKITTEGWYDEDGKYVENVTTKTL